MGDILAVLPRVIIPRIDRLAAELELDYKTNVRKD